MQRSLADLNRQWRRWIMLILVGVLTLACCAWTGLLGWFFTPFTPYFANHLDRVQGKLELLVPAQWEPGWSEVSPDGHWMVTSWAKTGHEELFVWDLVTGEQRAFSIAMSRLRWINANQFLVLDRTDNLVLVDAHNLSQLSVPLTQGNPEGQKRELDRIQAFWQAADQIYATKEFGMGGYTVVTITRGQPAGYRDFGTTDDVVKGMLNTVPHIDVPIYTWNKVTSVEVNGRIEQRLYAPNGLLYAVIDDQEGGWRVLIYTRSGELVADAGKDGWTATILGWAHDSSGVYIRTSIYGQAAGMMVPYRPIFKLSPLTPEEERAQWWSVGEWTVGSMAVVAVVGWVVWRRRRK